MDIYEHVQKIDSKEGFLEFMALLKKNFLESPDEWENINLINFLDGLEGYCFDDKRMEPSWKLFSEILLAARVYE